MEIRRPGEIPTLETRAEADEKVNRNLRYKQIIGILKGFPDGLTAKEIAFIMQGRGYCATSERNVSAPRLTELTEKGIVEPIGKRVCQFTGRKVAVYGLINPQGELVGTW